MVVVVMVSGSGGSGVWDVKQDPLYAKWCWLVSETKHMMVKREAASVRSHCSCQSIRGWVELGCKNPPAQGNHMQLKCVLSAAAWLAGGV